MMIVLIMMVVMISRSLEGLKVQGEPLHTSSLVERGGEVTYLNKLSNIDIRGCATGITSVRKAQDTQSSLCMYVCMCNIEVNRHSMSRRQGGPQAYLPTYLPT